MAQPHAGYSSAIKKKQAADAHKTLCESQRYYDASRKPVPEVSVLCNSIYVTFLKRQNYSDSEHISGWQGVRSQGRATIEGQHEGAPWKLSCICIVMGVT